MPSGPPDANKSAATRSGWIQLVALLALVLVGASILAALGLIRYEIDAAMVGAFVIFGLVKFAVSWLRADPTERKRWSYRGRHDGGGGLGPTTDRWHGEHRDD